MEYLSGCLKVVTRADCRPMSQSLVSTVLQQVVGSRAENLTYVVKRQSLIEMKATDWAAAH